VLVLVGTARAQGPDCRVNDPTADPNSGARCHEHGPAENPSGRAQSETSVLLLAPRLCVAWNKFREMQRAASDDGGQTFAHLGDFVAPGSGTPIADPSFVYRASDQRIYFAGIISLTGGIALLQSTGPDCDSFASLGKITSGSAFPPLNSDKVMLAADNWPPPERALYGRLYAAFVAPSDPNSSRGVWVASSAAPAQEPSALAWGQRVLLPGTGTGHAPWPAVAPNGQVFVALSDRGGGNPASPLSYRVFRSEDGGAIWTETTAIASALSEPKDADASSAEICGRPALGGELGGEIRTFPFAVQIAIHQTTQDPNDFSIHAVYAYDPDGAGPDDADVFYRRSDDGAGSWSTEHRLNLDDTTTTDQWSPAIAVTPAGLVAASWYDRGLDPANVRFDRFMAMSDDGGRT
jgi:hypothetical protein